MADVEFSATPTTEASFRATLSVISVALIAAAPIVAASAVATVTGGNSALQGAAATDVTARASVTPSSSIGLQAAASTAVTATASLGGKNSDLQASTSTDVAAVADLVSIGSVGIQSVASTSMVAIAALTGSSIPLSAAPSAALAALATLNGAAASFAATPSTACEAEADLTGASDIRTRSVCSIVHESLALWGFLCPECAPHYAQERAITDLNTALQLVWNNADGKDYWSKETLEITLDDGEDSYNLPDEIQNVKGLCRRDDTKQPLAALYSASELESFVDLYLDGDEATGPVAYHIDTMKQSGEEPAKTVFRVTPAVSGASVTFLLDVVKEAPRFTVDDLQTCPPVPIPHRYAETLLIPIVRYNASSYYLFEALDPKQKETIDREYQQARIQLGLADPNPVREPEPRKGGDK